MKLHFSWPEVAKALDEVRAATVVKPLHGKITGKGLWLVADEGVYLMPNTEGETRTIAYAKECDPNKVDDWWDVKRATFGGDDGVEFISIEEIERISAGPSGAQPQSLCIKFTQKRMTISVQWKRVGSGTGTLSITDALLADVTFGSLTVGGSSAGAVDIDTAHAFTGPATFISGSGTDITLDGALSSSSGGTAFTLSSGRKFVNDAGTGAFDLTGGGRWLIYSHDAASDMFGGLLPDFHRYSCAYGGSCPSFPGSGNGTLYSTTPLLTVTPDALASLPYGSAAPTLTGYSYDVSGYLGSDGPLDALTGALSGSTPYTRRSAAGSYAIDYASGALASALGYGFTYAGNASGITILPAPAASATASALPTSVSTIAISNSFSQPAFLAFNSSSGQSGNSNGFSSGIYVDRSLLDPASGGGPPWWDGVMP